MIFYNRKRILTCILPNSCVIYINDSFADEYYTCHGNFIAIKYIHIHNTHKDFSSSNTVDSCI